MLKFLRRFIKNFKEYILLVILSVLSLSILASNDKPQAKRLKAFAFGSFSVLNEFATSLTSVFRKDDSFASLKEENARLMLEVNRMRKAAFENNKLRTMIAFRDTCEYPLIPANVVSKLITKTQGNYIINRGANDQVQRGMPVISQVGLIGIVTDVAGNYSAVKTLNNGNLSIAVTIQKMNVDGILNFDGSNLVIKNVPATFDVQVGDRIITSEFSTLFPPSVPIGTIRKKESNVYGLLLNLYVEPFADIAGADNLFILKVIPSKEINQLDMNLMK